MLRKLLGIRSQKTPRAAPVLSDGIKDSILNVIGNKGIPTMPGSAQKAFKLSIDPNAEARDFIEVIESDEALSARVIKIANSVFFDRGKSSKTIEEAVLVIGINELRSLLSSTSLSELFPSKDNLRACIWAHDVASALIAKTLAGRICPDNAEMAFLSGLMHDIGKLLLIQRVPGDYNKAIKMLSSEGMDFCSAEEQVFAFTHTEVGLLIAEKWNFGQELKEVVQTHHQSWDWIKGNCQNWQLIHIVKAASIFAHALGLGHPREFNRIKTRNLELCSEALTHLGIPLEEEKALLATFHRLFETEFDLYSGKSSNAG